jgi:hypothetical protein
MAEPTTTTPSPSPGTNEVETELRRLARQRLTIGEGETAPSQHRISLSLRRRHQPLVGAFDSPQGFAFAAGETNHRR